MKRISDMSFKDFLKKYIKLAKYAMESEKKGKLDQYHHSYVPMTEEEQKLYEKDWKAFSKERGFSEKDINEYSKWYKISGQEDKITFAVNDPWRRGFMSKEGYIDEGYVKYLYDKHLEKEKTQVVKSKMKEKPKEISLEKKLVSGIFILSFLSGLLFVSSNITGNVIGNFGTRQSNIFGVVLFLFGLFGLSIYQKTFNQ